MFSVTEKLNRDMHYDILRTVTSSWEWHLDMMRNSDEFTLDDIAESLTTHKKAIKAMQKYELETFGKVLTDD